MKSMSKTPSDKSKPKIRVNKNMRDYSYEPAFVQAAERATVWLEKVTDEEYNK